MENGNEQPVNYPLCLICSSSVITPDIKVEPCFDNNDDDQTFIIFLLATLLEIPENDIVQLQEELVNCQLNTFYCESCTKLVYSSRQVYAEILELTRKFRKVQKQIVHHISNYGDLQRSTTILTNAKYDGILDFCRNFLNKHDFNGFGYPFVVNEIPRSRSTKYTEEEPPVEVDKVKEEPISEDENVNDDCEDNEDEDYLQDSDEPSADEDNPTGSDSDFEPEPPRKNYKKPPPNSSLVKSIETDEDDVRNSFSSSADEESEREGDSDFEPSPPPPPPKKAVKKAPIKKSLSLTSSSSQKDNQTSCPATSTSKPPHQRKKPIPPKKQSKFDIRYPNYPKRIRDPGTKKFHCSEPSCSKSYPRKTRLETHIMIQHLQDNNFKCEVPLCGKSYANPESFQDHVSWHAGIARWKCEEKVTDPDGGTTQCPEAYFDRRKLVRHVQKIHQSDNPFICELCGSKFSCKDYLTSHKIVKHKEKGNKIKGKYPTKTPTPQICDYCGKSYSSKPTLEMHINMVHEKTVGKLPCQFCDLKFNARTHLKMHMFRKHKFSLDGFKPKPFKATYQCDVKRCRMNFTREDAWRTHMEDKHGEGKEGVYEFSCKYCGKGYHLRWKLDYHEEAHQNKESKPFSCEICGNRFARLPYLKIHKKNIHKIPMENARKEVIN